MTEAVHDEADRRKHFDRIVRALRADLQRKFCVPWVEQFEVDTSPVFAALDAAEEACFRMAFERASDYTPNKAFKRHARALLEEAVRPETDAVNSAIREAERAEIAHDIEQITATRNAIHRLVRRVESGRFPERHTPVPSTSSSWERCGVRPWWKGADVIIAAEPLVGYRGGSTVVVTEHGLPLTQLFHRLVRVTNALLDHMTRYEFFITMADHVNDGLASAPDVSATGMLLWALWAADAVLCKWHRRLDSTATANPEQAKVLVGKHDKPHVFEASHPDTTMLPRKVVQCAVCGSEQACYLPCVGDIGNNFEMAPVPMMDSPMFTWVQHCAHCDYCADDISQAPESVAGIVDEPAYRQLVAEGVQPVESPPSFMDDLFSRPPEDEQSGAHGALVVEDRDFHPTTDFLCRSYIQERLGQYSQAAWAQMHSAWLYDAEGRKMRGKRGNGKRNKATECRSKAIELFARAAELGQGSARRRELEATVRTELLRRLGRFEEAAGLVQAHDQSTVSDDVRMILTFQHGLIEQQDDAWHELGEVGLPAIGHEDWRPLYQLY